MPTSVVLSTENCASLSNLYWSLWRLMGGTAELQQPVQAPMEDIVQSGIVCSDFRIAREYLQGGPGSASADYANFRDYLRDMGLRYAQLADSRPVAPTPAER